MNTQQSVQPSSILYGNKYQINTFCFLIYDTVSELLQAVDNALVRCKVWSLKEFHDYLPSLVISLPYRHVLKFADLIH